MHTEVKGQIENKTKAFSRHKALKNGNNRGRLSPIIANPEASKIGARHVVLLFKLSKDAALWLRRVVHSRV